MVDQDGRPIIDIYKELRNKVEKIQEEILEKESKYLELLEKHNKLLEECTELLTDNIRLGKLK